MIGSNGELRAWVDKMLCRAEDIERAGRGVALGDRRAARRWHAEELPFADEVRTVMQPIDGVWQHRLDMFHAKMEAAITAVRQLLKNQDEDFVLWNAYHRCRHRELMALRDALLDGSAVFRFDAAAARSGSGRRKPGPAPGAFSRYSAADNSVMAEITTMLTTDRTLSRMAAARRAVDAHPEAFGGPTSRDSHARRLLKRLRGQTAAESGYNET